ncbi:MAG: ABC transporter ATP-binding protein [Coriobacteriales bacterium]|nr:ABC transporter ATP-binding protein [Coriobacteriales bacterium]
MSGVAITVADVRLKLDKKSAFELAVDRLQVGAGEALAVLGPSGSGKTTLLEVLGLLRPVQAGRILYDGQVADRGSRDDRLLSAAVFQRPWLFKGPVASNVGYGLSARGVPRAERSRIVESMLERVGLSGRGGDSALRLSGGEAQRVSLARALAVSPRILLVDEPLASLDPMLKRRLTEEFSSIVRDTGATLVWVTHDQDEAQIVADHVAVMRDGRVVECGLTQEVLNLPGDEWVAAFLGLQTPQAGVVIGVSEGLSLVRASEAEVWVAGETEVGSSVDFAVRPEDVLLFEPGVDLPLTTARNRLSARVVSVEPRGATYQVVLDARGVLLASSVSRAAVRELSLAPGAQVLAVFKASAVTWRASAAAGGTVAASGEDSTHTRDRHLNTAHGGPAE